MVKLHNPLAFTPGPVSFFTTLIYVALITSLIVVHTQVPPAPNSATPVTGINITEAWIDLQHITSFYHHFNTHANDEVREYLLQRIDEILKENGAKISYPKLENEDTGTAGEVADAYVFDDLTSNVTSSGGSYSVYFEGTNIVVYIRGTDDDQSNWWEKKNANPSGQNGVLINAHYDSVPAGFGATDTGVGVISVLQLIKYYSTPENKPRRGVVALLNNGEEDFLNGARAFGSHPFSRFPHTFLNLEGVGAGGRAVMFRATDAETAAAYHKAPSPFSSVVFCDAFNHGAVRSQTDYVIFNGDMGMRGLDVAFYEPRARYHTDQDDTRHTSKDSLWHMLSGALATTQVLTSEKTNEYDGKPSSNGKVNAGTGSNGVWFDLFGRVFAVFKLHTFFALSVTLLVVAPVFLTITSFILYEVDKFYLFSASRLYHLVDGDEEVKLYGWRGFFRFPAIIVITSATPVALAFLLNKINPMIIHSSQWSVWAMMFSAWLFVAWFLCCAAYFTRPSAFTRIYGYIWLSVFVWALLIANTVFENQYQVASGYFLVFYFAALFLATWISHLELFSLPKKSKHCQSKMHGYDSIAASQFLSPEAERTSSSHQEADDDEANESTSLLRGERRTTFANYSRTDEEPDTPVTPVSEPPKKESGAYKDEQDWSASMPTWTWLLQFLLTAPIATIFCLQTGFMLVTALNQTSPDGSSTLPPYLISAIFTVLTLIPLLPVLHRVTWHLPIFLLFVLIGTLVYNLMAFPFSTNNRIKLSFQQLVDVDTGMNNATLRGPLDYVLDVISDLPSAAGQPVSCSPFPGREPMQRCSWPGIPPNAASAAMMASAEIPVKDRYKDWVNFDVTRPSPASSNPNSARFLVHGKDSRACKITFEQPISKVNVLDAGPIDRRFRTVPDAGAKELQLYSRTWNRTWTVDVEWSDGENIDFDSISNDLKDDKRQKIASGFQGKLICLWSDNNQIGLIPALDEVRHFAPTWVAVTNAGSGLVEVSQKFSV